MVNEIPEELVSTIYEPWDFKHPKSKEIILTEGILIKDIYPMATWFEKQLEKVDGYVDLLLGETNPKLRERYRAGAACRTALSHELLLVEEVYLPSFTIPLIQQQIYDIFKREDIDETIEVARESEEIFLALKNNTSL